MSNLDPSYIVGVSFFGVIIILLLACAVGAWRDDCRKAAAWIVAVAVGLFGVWYWFNYPAFDLEQHSYRTVTGKVTEIERNNDVWMFELKSDDRDLKCSDSWCTKVEVGDTLTLDCLPEEFASARANTWDCEFVKVKETDRV